jgi:hypothetical protein
MKLTIDTVKMTVTVIEPTSLYDILTHLQKTYGDEWKNLKLVCQDGGCVHHHNEIINHYYGGDDPGYIEPGMN